MGIISQLKAGMVLPSLTATSKDEVLLELAGAVHHAQPQLASQTLLELLKERESLGSTGIGDGIAIPHGKIKGLGQITICFGRSKQGIAFDALDGKPTHLFFLLLAPEEAAAPYLGCLAELSRFLKNPQTRSRLMQAADKEELLDIFAEAD